MVLLSGQQAGAWWEPVCVILPTPTHQVRSCFMCSHLELLQTSLSSFLREAALMLGRLGGILPYLCIFSPHFQSRCFSDFWVWPLLRKAHSRFSF